jgi:hypothetical protein
VFGKDAASISDSRIVDSTRYQPSVISARELLLSPHFKNNIYNIKSGTKIKTEVKNLSGLCWAGGNEYPTPWVSPQNRASGVTEPPLRTSGDLTRLAISIRCSDTEQ